MKAAGLSNTWNNTLCWFVRFVHRLASLKHLWHCSVVIALLKLLNLHSFRCFYSGFRPSYQSCIVITCMCEQRRPYCYHPQVPDAEMLNTFDQNLNGAMKNQDYYTAGLEFQQIEYWLLIHVVGEQPGRTFFCCPNRRTFQLLCYLLQCTLVHTLISKAEHKHA